MTDKSEKIVALVQPDPNKDLVAALKEMLADAEVGEFTSAVITRRRANGNFKTDVVGIWSDLEKIGALTFAIFDVMNGNPPEKD